MHARITVRKKSAVLDPQGEAIERALHGLGHGSARGVRVGKVIELEIDGDRAAVEAELKKMADELLANPVMETFTVEIVDEKRT